MKWKYWILTGGKLWSNCHRADCSNADRPGAIPQHNGLTAFGKVSWLWCLIKTVDDPDNVDKWYWWIYPDDGDNNDTDENTPFSSESVFTNIWTLMAISSFADGGSRDEQARDHGWPLAHLSADCQRRPRCLWGHYFLFHLTFSPFISFVFSFCYLFKHTSVSSTYPCQSVRP